MTTASRIVEAGDGGISWSKWSVAAILGVPVAAGVGYWCWRHFGTEIGLGKKSPSSDGRTRSALDVPRKIGEADASEFTAGMTEEQNPLKKALAHKDAGNKLFKAGKYAEAIECYNMAIEVCPTDKKQDLATFYQNRAAAYEQMKVYERVKEDCSKALELNPKYVKALQRRAKACELTQDLLQSLEDVTAACMLEGFQNQTTLLTADRVLKELGRKHAKEAMAKRVPIMPSKHFIKTYFSSFVEDPFTKSLKNGKESDSAEADLRGLARARQAFIQQNFEDIIPACTEEISSVDSSNKDEARILRATFYLLLGDHDNALEDFAIVVNSDEADVKLRVNALIKRASLHMQLEEPSKSIEDFHLAVKLDSENSDIYHHRGQVHLLMEKMDEAIADFNKSVAINPNFPISYVQKCYSDYRHAFNTRNMEMMQEVMRAFQSAIERFPGCSECYTLYAQVLSDQQEYEKADQHFKKAIEVDPENATIYVHRGLLHLQWNGDLSKAVELITHALKLDSKCEFAHETLGTIEVQRGNLRRAIELFDKAIPLAKTEMEMSHLFSLRDAAVAQAKVADKMGINISNVGLP
ncbi:mitochondrial import receptor subunit TOM70 [Bacillus rossius redtenbacheri]|uniref:mitochondrial import receptor subunit TOM70 n=1 Tax=Bacillus rossius redtenbacheri TaxID=93214 RepID=UPI002FDEAB6F